MSFFKPGKASVIIDGQFGSTGKGLAAAYQWITNEKLVDRLNLISVTNAAPNAGHTTVLPSGWKFVTYHMPTIGVLAKDSTIYLNAGAIIDYDVLKAELKDLGISPHRVVIHPHAAVITHEDRAYERDRASGTTKIASTQKGVGRALARKIMREGVIARDIKDKLEKLGVNVQAIDLNREMSTGSTVVIETPQGMGLSLNNGFYPHCTSREVSVAQSLSDAGVHPNYLHQTLMVIRTFPIRVGNIHDEDGREIGNSGGGYDDQIEMHWEDFPGVEPERTTVTQRVRRIFSFSQQQFEESLRRLRPDIIHVGFCDYFTDAVEFENFLDQINDSYKSQSHTPKHVFFSFGPSTNDVYNYTEARGKFK
jgi:adenylosuccinate synthase